MDLNGEETKFKKRNTSATIVANVRRFCHRINTDEVFGTHRGVELLVDARQLEEIIVLVVVIWSKRCRCDRGLSVGTTSRADYRPKGPYNRVNYCRLLYSRGNFANVCDSILERLHFCFHLIRYCLKVCVGRANDDRSRFIES